MREVLGSGLFRDWQPSAGLGQPRRAIDDLCDRIDDLCDRIGTVVAA